MNRLTFLILCLSAQIRPVPTAAQQAAHPHDSLQGAVRVVDLRARALARRSSEGLDIPDLVSTEQELSRIEGDCRERLLAHSQNGGDRGANRRL